MATRLWNYVSTYSNLKGDKLAEIYKKLRQEPAPPDPTAVRGPSQDPNHSGAAAAAGPSGRDSEHNHFNSNKRQFNQSVGNIIAAQGGEPSRGDAESWKRRQRDVDPPLNGPMHNNNHRKPWENSGRPGSADGWRNRAAGSPPINIPGAAVNNGSGNLGWGHNMNDMKADPWRGPHDHRNGPRDWNRRDQGTNNHPRPHPRPAAGGQPSSYGHAPPTFTR